MEARGQAGLRRWLAVCGGVLVLFLGGCFNYDAANPQIWYHNLTDQIMVVSIEGTDIPLIQRVDPRGGPDAEVVIDDCVGTALVVATEEGEPVGRVDEPACPGWSLTINEDHSLTYKKD